eukprot:6545649-Prymnesium_polylepis.1
MSSTLQKGTNDHEDNQHGPKQDMTVVSTTEKAMEIEKKALEMEVELLKSKMKLMEDSMVDKLAAAKEAGRAEVRDDAKKAFTEGYDKAVEMFKTVQATMKG